MGYGVYVTGEPHTRLAPDSSANDKHIISAIHEAIEAVLTDPLQRHLTTLHVTENRLELDLHPSAESVEISVKNGKIDVSAKTSTAGPGYHAWLVEFLETVATHAAIDLSWDDLEVGWSDETGYRMHRDMELLREEAIRWLKTISGDITSKGDDYINILVNLPTDDRPLGNAFVLAPMGEFSRDWFLSICNASDSDAAIMAESFFPAWHGPERAEYWANIGRYLMLWDLDWTVPIDDAERARYNGMLACYEKAIQIDPATTVPHPEILEARELRESEDVDMLPRPDGAGYRRGILGRDLNYGWQAEIPGYFRRIHETDGEKENTCFRYGDREIHYTVLSFETVEGGTTAAEFVLRNTAPKEGETLLMFNLRRDWLTGRAIVKVPDGHCTIQAMFGVTWKNEHRVLILTIVHEDTTAGQQWAATLLESVSHPAPSLD